MSDLLQSLKTEITRLSRKEIKAAIAPLQESNVKLKKTVGELKARISELENRKQLDKFTYHKGDIVEDRKLSASSEQPTSIRITPKAIINLRTKFGLSREAFAKLLGISTQNVFAMEHKEGRLKMRSATLSKYLVVKGLSKKAALEQLGELEGK